MTMQAMILPISPRSCCGEMATTVVNGRKRKHVQPNPRLRPISCGRVWPDDGAFAFPCAPNAEPAENPALWSPEDMPGVVILDSPASSAFTLPTGVEILADHVVAGERHLVLASLAGRVRLCIRQADARIAPTIVITMDAHAAKRLAAAAVAEGIVFRHILPKSRISVPTAYQRRRLVLMLKVHDAVLGGASHRDVAFGHIFPRNRPLVGAEWKGSSECRHTHRFISELRQMVSAGYRKLLLQG